MNRYSMEDSILIIGEGSDAHEGAIKKYKNIDEIKFYHENTELYEAYKIPDDIGVENIYTLNIKNISSYMDIINLLIHYQFKYVVPIGIKISDTFINKVDDKRSNFLNEYSKLITPNSGSTFIYTDEHASYYESIDHFLIDQKNRLYDTLDLVENKDGLNRHVFVLNSLIECEYPNVLLASVLMKTPVGEYPTYDFGESVFDLDYFDVNSDIVYFKNNFKRETTLENPVNLREKRDPYKNLLIQRMVDYIEEGLDLSEFRSQLYTARVRVSIDEKLTSYFNSLLGTVIRGYYIRDVRFKVVSPGAGVLIVKVDVLPINFIDKISINKEV